MRSFASVVTTVLIGGTLTTACNERASDQAGAEQEPGAAPADVAAQPVSDTTAAALWQHLQDQRYRESWRQWPGKAQLYAGTEPHGMLLTTYTNDVAYEALMSGQAADLPDGSIIVKENYMPDSTFAAATVMYKVAGYNPEHQDWLFAKYDPQGTPEDFGRAPMCQACHQQAVSGYIYTAVQR
jgi:hypothetical protein